MAMHLTKVVTAMAVVHLTYRKLRAIYNDTRKR